MSRSFRTTLLIFALFFVGFDIVDTAITCNRAAGNMTLADCTGSVCLIRRDKSDTPLKFDCGEGAYYTHYPDGCYGANSLLCVCRSSKCNTASFVSSSQMNVNKSMINCHGALAGITSSTGSCSGRFCISHSANPIPAYYCILDTPTLLSFAPFVGLCYHFEYGQNDNTTKMGGSICVCDTEYCSDGITALPSAPETITTGNTTTAGVVCYTDANSTVTCRGDVCFIHRDTLSGTVERGCLISQRNAESRRLLIPSYTRDVFIDYYICKTPQCNRNIITANASIAATPSLGTTPNPLNPGTTPDEWWETPSGWTGGPNSSWYNDTWFNDTDGNATNGTGTPGKGNNFSQQYTLPFSFLMLLITTLIIA